MGHTAVLAFVYAAVLLIGGIMGYIRAQSNVSLVAGIGSAIVAAVAGALAASHPHAALGLTGLLALAMIVVFALRYRKTHRPMPAVPMLAISTIVLLVCGYELLKSFGARAAGA